MPRLAFGLRSKARRLTPSNLLGAARSARSRDVLLVDWVNRGPVRENWGDAVAPYLVKALAGKTAANYRDTLNLARKPVFTTIGSMLGTTRAPDVIVWGTGFVSASSHMRVTPSEVCAVRGPLTRAKLIEDGINCPELFGDPALLFAQIYKPSVERSHQLGLIPHWRERELPEVVRLAQQDDVLFIDICAGIETVADNINRCDMIASSSLHGLVAADGYGIPATWVTFSDRPYGDGFKFRDYLQATGRRFVEPLEVVKTTMVPQVLDRLSGHRFELDLDGFVDACPFADSAAYQSSKDNCHLPPEL